jgi:hypothetical protein
MPERGRRSEKLHENHLAPASLEMDQSLSLPTPTYEVVLLPETDPDQNGRCTIMCRVDMQVVGDQPDLRLRDTTIALMSMPDGGAFQIIISSHRQLFHHMRSMDSQRLISTLMQSGPHHHVDIASRDITLRIQAKMNLLLPAQREDPKRAHLLQPRVDTHLQTTDHLLLPATHRHRSVLIALM